MPKTRSPAALGALWLCAVVLSAAPAARASEGPPDERAAPYASTADGLPTQTRDRVLRSHRFGVAGIVMTGAGVPLLMGATRGFSGSWDNREDRTDGGNIGAFGGSAVLAGLGLGSVVLGPTFLLSSSLKNSKRLQAIDSAHPRMPGWLGLASAGGAYFAPVVAPEAVVVPTAIGFYVGAVSGGVVQHVMNAHLARSAGILPMRDVDVAIRFSVQPGSIQVAGTF